VVRALLVAALLLLFTVLIGCSATGYLSPQKLAYSKLALPYERTQLGVSTTLDVLNVARAPEYQFDPDIVEETLLTQSDTAVAYSGRSADGFKTWVNLVVFDEYRLTAKRKCFFAVDERAVRSPEKSGQLFIPPRRGILFDSEFAIDPEILTTPYATEEARRTAIVRRLAEQFQRDLTALIGDPAAPARGNALIPLSGMMMNQTFTGLLIELDRSPGLAANLDSPKGIAFPHISLNEGRIRLLTQNDRAAVRIRVNLPMHAAR
jgi:hypothetical protein